MGARMIIYWAVLLISFSAIVKAQCPPSTTSPIALQDFVKYQETFAPLLNFEESTTCTWTINANNRIRYQLTSVCMDATDTLEVYDGTTLIEKVMNSVESGNARSLGLTTSSSWIVKITSGPGIRTKDLQFVINAISAVENSNIVNPPAGGTATASLTASPQKKFLTSPSYPDKYPNHATWTWTITGVGSQYIEFTIAFLDVELDVGGNCVYDKITIIADGVTQETCVEKSWVTRTTISNGDEMTFSLFSDSAFNARGFVASYCAVYTELGGSCNDTVECKDENAVCADNICKCKSGYFQNEDDCEAQKDLGGSCNSDDECKEPNAVCTNNICKCKSGYVQNGDVCEVPCNGDQNMLFCPENKVCYCKPGMIKLNGKCCDWRKCKNGFSRCIKRYYKCRSFARKICISGCKRRYRNGKARYYCLKACTRHRRSYCLGCKKVCFWNTAKACLPGNKSYWYRGLYYWAWCTYKKGFCKGDDCPSLTKYCCSTKFESCRCAKGYKIQSDGSCV